MVSAPATMRSGAPDAVVATLPLASSISTVTGMTGALNLVVRFSDGSRPTIVNGHTDCGLPSLSNPGVVNERVKLVSESIAGCAALAMPASGAVCALFGALIDFAVRRNEAGTCIALVTATACWLVFVVMVDAPSAHPPMATNIRAAIRVFPMVPPRASYHHCAGSRTVVRWHSCANCNAEIAHRSGRIHPRSPSKNGVPVSQWQDQGHGRTAAMSSTADRSASACQ